MTKSLEPTDPISSERSSVLLISPTGPSENPFSLKDEILVTSTENMKQGNDIQRPQSSKKLAHSTISSLDFRLQQIVLMEPLTLYSQETSTLPPLSIWYFEPQFPKMRLGTYMASSEARRWSRDCTMRRTGGCHSIWTAKEFKCTRS